MIIEHTFTAKIKKILAEHFDKNSSAIFESSLLVRYINMKTRSATRGAKARSAYANHYVLLALLEDYIKGGFFDSKNDYAQYDGAKFTELLQRIRSLPFGSKLQNHAFNS
jgi:hypothetical protein